MWIVLAGACTKAMEFWSRVKGSRAMRQGCWGMD